MDKKIEKLIIKFITKEANLDELRQLELWIDNVENDRLFFDFINTNAYINISMNEYDVQSAKGKILKRIKQEQLKTNRYPKTLVILKYAAAVVLVFSLGYYINQENGIILNENHSTNVGNQITSGTDKATLTLEDGSQIALEKGSTYVAGNKRSDGENLIYAESPSKTTNETSYNYLMIPRGGQFFVKLADGTKVTLNSESKLKYPTAFIDGETRKVELLYGEAYFEVSPSTAHKGAKFKVYSGAQEIEVLGTEFNIKAYQDESTIRTTLVEGKVTVNNDFGEFTLRPFEQAVINKNTNLTKVVQLEKIYDEIAWKDGVFSFKNKELSEIVNVLRRWYNADFKFENPEIKRILFTGILGKEQQIEQILSAIKITNNIDYEINDKVIILK